MAKKNDNRPATVKEVREIVIDASEAILKGVDRMFEEQNGRIDKRFKRVDERFKQVDERFKQVDERFNKLEVEISYIKDTANGLKADLADTPTKKEHEELKAKVEKYHPLI